ncbi:MAG: hypothetical protein SVX28_03770 [Pseudomonadota bacterium]|nr:hypothetical protein [Pseudomonadota bacterium]
MKKSTTIAALSVITLLTAGPLLVSADDDDRDDNRYEHRRDGTGANFKQYSTEEMRIMAHGQALRRYGPGVEVSVEETPDGTYRVQFRDADQNLIREQEFNQYGVPARGGYRN